MRGDGRPGSWEPVAAILPRGHAGLFAWIMLSGKCLCSGLQPLQGQRVRVSQVDAIEFALTLAVRFPVRIPGTQHALVCRKGDRLLDEGKRALLLQPVVPGRSPNENRINLFLRLEKPTAFHSRDCLLHMDPPLYRALFRMLTVKVLVLLTHHVTPYATG